MKETKPPLVALTPEPEINKIMQTFIAEMDRLVERRLSVDRRLQCGRDAFPRCRRAFNEMPSR